MYKRQAQDSVAATVLVTYNAPWRKKQLRDVYKRQDEASEHEMLVYYSLGNFVNWTSGTGEGVANRMVGGMAEVTITKNDNGEVEIEDYGVKPIISHVISGPEGVTTYFLSDYTDVLSEENEIRSQDPEFSREYCINLCNTVWGNLWDEEKD